MSDFVEEEELEIEISGRVFKFHEPSGAEYDRWLEKYISLSSDEVVNIDFAKRNEGLLEFIVDAPYKLIDGKEFREGSVIERTALLQKLKPGIRSSLIKQILKLMEVPEDLKKN